MVRLSAEYAELLKGERESHNESASGSEVEGKRAAGIPGTSSAEGEKRYGGGESVAA